MKYTKEQIREICSNLHALYMQDQGKPFFDRLIEEYEEILEDDEKLEEMTAYWNTLEEKEREEEENYTFEEKMLAQCEKVTMDEFDCFFDLREWLS